MKMKLLAIFAGMVLMGCGDPVSDVRNHELRMQESKQKHELEMARLQSGVGTAAPVQQYSAPEQGVYHEPVQPAQQSYSDGTAYGDQSGSSGESDSGIGGTLLAVGGGMLAGYAISELLDDGYRSYSDKSGRTVYVDKNGRQIDKRDYDAYKAKHPKKHALSSYNQKGKQAINTGATKVVDTSKAAAKKVDQKVVQPTKKAVAKKTSSFKKSTSKRK